MICNSESATAAVSPYLLALEVEFCSFGHGDKELLQGQADLVVLVYGPESRLRGLGVWEETPEESLIPDLEGRVLIALGPSPSASRVILPVPASFSTPAVTTSLST